VCNYISPLSTSISGLPHTWGTEDRYKESQLASRGEWKARPNISDSKASLVTETDSLGINDDVTKCKYVALVLAK
jgi:hypothetical protein